MCAPHPPDKALDNTLASAYKPYHIFLNQSWQIHHCCRSMSLVVSGAYAEEMPGGPTSGSLSLQLVQVGGGCEADSELHGNAVFSFQMKRNRAW